jgi:hypothetical protein
MDQETFDTLARSAGLHGETRRTLLRLVAGGAFAGVAAHFGLLAGEARSANKHKASNRKRATLHRRGPHASQAGGGLQTEGKGTGKGRRNGKGKGKHHPKPPKNPQPPDPPCPDGQGQCPDGACVPFDECCSDQFRCSDGSCVFIFDCCPDEKRCNAELCIKDTLCCPGEKRCGSPGNCISADLCCDEDPPPLCTECQELVCDRGAWTCRAKAGLDACQRVCPQGAAPCPMVTQAITGLPNGCCQADRIFPDVWYGTGNSYCRPPYDPGSYWCTMDGLPGV